MTRCNERDELFDPTIRQSLLLMDTVLDNPCIKLGKTNAKDNSRTYLNANQTAVKLEYCE